MVAAITTAASTLSTDFISLFTSAAPLVLTLVVGVAGVRAVIKLFNRAIGK